MSGVRVPYGPFNPLPVPTTDPAHGDRMDATLKFNVNGQARQVSSDPDRPLLDVLREDLGLTGTKYGCGEGQCGACSVLLDDKRVFSCRTRVAAADGKSVTTIEGVADGE